MAWLVISPKSPSLYQTGLQGVRQGSSPVCQSHGTYVHERVLEWHFIVFNQSLGLKFPCTWVPITNWWCMDHIWPLWDWCCGVNQTSLFSSSIRRLYQLHQVRICLLDGTCVFNLIINRYCSRLGFWNSTCQTRIGITISGYYHGIVDGKGYQWNQAIPHYWALLFGP
jgi:hypothetical protein